MDWYSWLSKSGLEPSLVYEYSLLFTNNELEDEDIAHFNHEFLQSMGISIAKHRLEILKLAKKLHRRGTPQPVARLLAAVIKTKKCLARYINGLVIHRDRSAIVVVPKPDSGGGGGGRWKGAMVRRNKRLVMLKQGKLMITEGGGFRIRRASTKSVSHSSSPMVYKSGGGDEGDEFWGHGEEIKWDSMFQNLKPT